jgi:hypothetical protein
MASPKSIKQIVNDAKSAAQLNVDFEREYGRKPNSNEGADLTNYWLKKTTNNSSVSTGSSYGSGLGSDSTTSTQTQTGGSSSYIDKLVGGLSTGFKMAVGLVDGVAKVTAGAVKLGLDTQIGKGQGDDVLLEIAETIKTQGLLGGAAELALKGSIVGINSLQAKKIHASEWSWLGTKYDILINNDGTVDDLYDKVAEFVEEKSQIRIV